MIYNPKKEYLRLREDGFSKEEALSLVRTEAITFMFNDCFGHELYLALEKVFKAPLEDIGNQIEGLKECIEGKNE